MRKLNIEQANHSDIVAVNIDKNLVGYIESEFENGYKLYKIHLM